MHNTWGGVGVCFFSVVATTLTERGLPEHTLQAFRTQRHVLLSLVGNLDMMFKIASYFEAVLLRLVLNIT